jgi:hypothetical protein
MTSLPASSIAVFFYFVLKLPHTPLPSEQGNSSWGAQAAPASGLGLVETCVQKETKSKNPTGMLRLEEKDITFH